jgi:hypothetical protein
MFELFSVPIQFLKTDRAIAYKLKDTAAIKSLKLTGAKLIYSGKYAVHSVSQRLRLKYHSGFLTEQAEVLRKESK